jgi:hypothetical protein
MQTGGVGEQRRLCHRLWCPSMQSSSGMRKAYQDTMAMASTVAKWLILKQEQVFFIKSCGDPPGLDQVSTCTYIDNLRVFGRCRGNRSPGEKH